MRGGARVAPSSCRGPRGDECDDKDTGVARPSPAGKTGTRVSRETSEKRTYIHREHAGGKKGIKKREGKFEATLSGTLRSKQEIALKKRNNPHQWGEEGDDLQTTVKVRNRGKR